MALAGALHPLQRALAVALLLAVALAGLAVRVLSAPEPGGYRMAMAAAPGGGAYLADRDGSLLKIDGRGARVVSRLPGGRALDLASQGDRLLLGAEDGLFVSSDGGLRWKRAPVPGRGFLA